MEIPFNITVQTRGLLEADDTKLTSKSLLSSHAVNHSRTLHCTHEVHFHSLQITVTTIIIIIIIARAVSK